MAENLAEFTVQVRPVGSESDEQAHSCGDPIHLPPGRYALWVENEAWISPAATHVIASASGSGETGIEVVPAGRVTLPADLPESSDLELHLRHVEQRDYLVTGALLFEMQRKKAQGEVGEAGILMPRGLALAYLRDKASKRIEAISRPFEVRAGRTTVAPLAAPLDKSFLVAQLTRDEVPTGPDRRQDVFVKAAGRTLEPDFLVQIDRQVLALWYSLEAGKVELGAELDHESLPSVVVELARGEIAFVEQRLRKRPALQVRLSLPEALRDENLVVRVAKVSDKSVVAETKVEHAQVLDFAEMPVAELEVELQSSFGQLHERVDLSEGADASVLLEASLVELTGKVYLGSEEAPAAELDFVTTKGHKISVVADARGFYQMTSLGPVRQVVIRPEGAEGSLFRQFFAEAVAESGEKDFRLPDAQIAVDVVDHSTGRGISGASVAMRNVFVAKDAEGKPIPPASLGEPAPTDSVAQTVKTDADGKTRLLYLQEGDVEVTAFAALYQPLATITRPIRNGDRQKLEIRLEKLGEATKLRLLLSDGRAAVGAEAELLASLDSDDSLWAGLADLEGILSPPKAHQGAMVLIRHPDAAPWTGVFRLAGEDDEAVITLPAALPPLVARVRNAEGRPLAHASIRLRVSGGLWSESAMLFFGMNFAADPDGFWRVPSPPGALSILAYSPRQADAALAGQLDAHAIAITFPWPDIVEISGIE